MDKESFTEYFGFDYLTEDEIEKVFLYAKNIINFVNIKTGSILENDFDFLFTSETEDRMLEKNEFVSIAQRIKKRRIMDNCLVPTMLLTIPDENLNENQKRKFKSIKAVAFYVMSLLANESHKGQLDDELLECKGIINEAARRIRLILESRYQWMLDVLPPFDGEIEEIEKSLSILRKYYKKEDRIKEKSIALLHVLFKRYLGIKKNIIIKECQNTERVLHHLVIENESQDGDLTVTEYVTAPVNCIDGIAPLIQEADQSFGTKLLEVNDRNKRINNVSAKLRQSKVITDRLSMRQMQLSCDWQTLTEYERSKLLQASWQGATDGEVTDLVLILAILFGRSIKQTIKFIKSNKYISTEFLLFKGDNICALSSPIELPEHHIADYVKTLTIHTEDRVYLTVPKELVKALKIIRKSPTINEEKIDGMIRDKLFRINKKYGTRITLARIAMDLSVRLMRKAADKADIALICGFPPIKNPALFYYSPIGKRITELQHSDNAELLGQADIGATYPDIKKWNNAIGSQINIKPESVESLFGDLVNKLEQRHASIIDCIEFHNEYVLYVYLLLSLSTGYRPVSSPLGFFIDIDKHRKTIWVSDKEVRSSLAARMLKLPDTAMLQIQYYEQHLRKLEIELKLISHDATKCISESLAGSFPFLFYLEGQKIYPLIPSYLTKNLTKCWPFPLNWHRHFMRTQLRNAGISGDEVNAWMGHADFGEEALGPWSGFSLYTMAIIAGKVEDILNSIKIKAIPGI